MSNSMRTFDCQYDMPEKIKQCFFNEQERGDIVYNGSYVEWTVTTDANEIDEWGYGKDYKKVTDWLMKQGIKEGETVLIKHWW